MGGILGVGTGLTVWVRDLVARRGIRRRARRENDAARGIVRYGEVPAESLLAGSTHALVLGASDEVVCSAVDGFVRESAAQGMPSIVIAEDAQALFGALALAGGLGVRLVDASRPVYEPLASLAPWDAAELMAQALALVPNAPQEAPAYLGALARLLAHKGVPATVRMIEACPHNRLHEIIDSLELCGAIDAAEGADLRACLDVPPACRSFIQAFFREAVAEGVLLAPEGFAGPTISVTGATRAPAPSTLVLDVGSGRARALLALVFAEVGICLRRHLPLSVAVCARAVGGWDELGGALKGASRVRWALVTDEALEFFSSEEDLRRWTASCDRTLCFAQGHASSEIVSAVFGEYDKVDLSYTRSGGGGFGMFGINYSDGGSTTSSMTRERVVKPEELRSLARDEFFVLEDGQPGAGTGIAKR